MRYNFPLLIACLWLAACAADSAIRLSVGTGFFVSKDGHVLTNYHVVQHCKTFKLHNEHGGYPATLVAVDESHDLALLRTASSPQKSASFRSMSLPVLPGELLTIMGYPKKTWSKKTPVVTHARLLALSGPRGEPTMLQFEDVIEQGNSGGPLLDTAGNVVGVIFAKATTMRIQQRTQSVESVLHSDVAVNLDTVAGFLAAHNVAIRTGLHTSPLSEQEQIRRAKQFIVNVRCRVEK